MSLLWDTYGLHVHTLLLFESEAMRRATCSWLRFIPSKCPICMACALAIPPINQTSVPKWFLHLQFLWTKPPCQTPDVFNHSHHANSFLHFLSYIVYFSEWLWDHKVPRSRISSCQYARGKFPIDEGELTRPSRGDQPILTSSDTISETNPSSQDQTWIEDVESLFMVGKPGTHCTSKNAQTSLDQLLPPSRFQRRSSSSSTSARLSNHEESKNSCINPETAHELVNIDPRKPEIKPDPPNRDRTPRIVEDMLMLVRMYGSISQKFYGEVCGGLLVPICAPFLPERQYPLDNRSPSELVAPSRFCGWFFSYIAQSLSTGLCRGENTFVPDEITFQQNAANEFHNHRVPLWPMFYRRWRSHVLRISKATKLGHYPWGK